MRKIEREEIVKVVKIVAQNECGIKFKILCKPTYRMFILPEIKECLYRTKQISVKVGKGNIQMYVLQGR